MLLSRNSTRAQSVFGAVRGEKTACIYARSVLSLLSLTFFVHDGAFVWLPRQVIMMGGVLLWCHVHVTRPLNYSASKSAERAR